MNPDRDNAGSWKLIREIQKRHIDVERSNAVNLQNHRTSDSYQRPPEAEKGESFGDGFSLKRWTSKNSVYTKLAILCIMIAAFVLPLATSYALIVSALLIVLMLCGFVYTRIISRQNRQENPSNDTLHALKNEVENLQDLNWELKEREERYRSLADAFGDMTMDRKPNGEVIFINDSFASLLQLNPQDIVGKTFPFALEEIEENSEPNTVKTVNLKVKGIPRWLAWLDIPTRSDSAAENIIRTVARDITHQKQTELELISASQKAQSASKAKTQFLANVSHEMRTPLNGILGMSGLLADTDLSREQQTYVNAVHDSGIALLTLIEDILDMTLVEAGKLEIRSTQMAPHRLVEDACELLASRAHTKNISIGSFVAQSVPEQIVADAGRLRQVLINLIGNAIKFTDNGGVFVSCQNKISESGNKTLIFEVHDTGPGIDPKDQALIFEEFSQADNNSTRIHGGAGLGLSISKRIIQEMGGTIGLSSKPGKGSCFFFTLPIDESASDSNTLAIKADAAGNVTIVSEDSIIPHVLENYLLEQGYALNIIPRIADFNASDHDEKLSILLVDASIIENSISELKSILSEFPDAVLKIILLKPEERQNLEALKNTGFDGYLIKPVRKTSLMNIIEGKADIQEEQTKTEVHKSEAVNSDQNLRPKSVLLAEDNEINALLARTILEKAGHAVTRAINGREVLSLLDERKESDPFDLVLLDLQMPVMDGLDALERIRADEMRHDAVLPVYILTADEQETSRQTAMAAGATGFLTKPLQPEKLLRIVNDE